MVKSYFFALSLIPVVFMASVSLAQNSQCGEVFTSQDYQIEIQRDYFAQRLQNVIKDHRLNSSRSKTQWIGILPSKTRSVDTKIDKIDKAIWRASAHLQVEVGRIELQNSKGETLGLSLMSSALGGQISGASIQSALIKSLAQAWAQGSYFDVTKVIISHTHPGQGTLNFSKSDKEAFVAIKQDLEMLGLVHADLEAHLLATAFFSKFKKKGIVIPAEVRPVHDRVHSSLSLEAAARIWVQVETLGRSYKNGDIKLEQLFFEMPEEVKFLFKYYYKP